MRRFASGPGNVHIAIMGFCNSVPYVQRQMDLLLKEFVEFCRAYLENRDWGKKGGVRETPVILGKD